jgi:nicotinate-nucleotide adenylyltransferase
MKKLGIFGGTFDPIHNGHLMLAEHIRRECDLDKIIFMPNNIQPFKQGATTLPGKQRQRMLQLAISGREYFDITDIELDASGVSYTYNSIIALKKVYKDCEMFFILGEDIFSSIEKWHKFEELIGEAGFIVGLRPGSDRSTIEQLIEKQRSKHRAKITVVDNPQIDISSSRIREIVQTRDFFAGRDAIRDMVPSSVGDYIYLNGIYDCENAQGDRHIGTGVVRKLEATIRDFSKNADPKKRQRASHILYVKDLAIRLAKIYDVDVIKASMAALAHDYIKLFGSEEEKNSIEHGEMASKFLSDIFGIDDYDVLNTIKYHTTSRENPSKLEMIIFLADKLEIGRKYESVGQLRDLAASVSIEMAMFAVLKEVIEVLKCRGIVPSKDTMEAYDYFAEMHEHEIV